MDVLISEPDEIATVNRIIYDELCMGKILQDSKAAYAQIMEGLVKKGAQGIILGCTEIGLLVQQADRTVPLFDTAKIHAEAAVAYALEE